MHSRKNLVPIVLSFQKIIQELGDLPGPNNFTRGKFTLKPTSKYSKNWNSATQKVHLGKKEEKATSACKNTVIHDAENLGLVPK